MDWDARVEKLRTATIAAVDALTPLLEGQRLYAICLQTADDGMSVGFCANTEEGYAEKRASEAEVEEMTPQYSAYLRWAPAEWRYEFFGDDHFADVNSDLTAASLDGNEDFSAYFDRLIDAMIDALAYLRAERAQALDGVTLFVTISDSEEAKAVERRSADRLNPPTLAGQFGQPLN
ncbi:DUF4303 domain-containing protein [Caulobacter sp. 1776]|uniref:DUF4303 domain-containing protein n=1 Tax=Caulobacter sp. 1776 TaxID=3156420 RepID=UPI003393EF43